MAMIAISPSLQWNEQALVARAKTLLGSKDKTKKLAGDVFITVGDEGMGLLGGVYKLSGLLTEKAPSSLRWKFEHMPKETHGSVPHRSTYNGLEFIFADWQMKDASDAFAAGGWKAIEAHYAKLSTKFGYQVGVPTGTVRDVMMGMINAKRLRDALTLGNKLATKKDANQLVPAGFWLFLARRFRAEKDPEGVTAALRGCLEVDPKNAAARKQLDAMARAKGAASGKSAASTHSAAKK